MVVSRAAPRLRFLGACGTVTGSRFLLEGEERLSSTVACSRETVRCGAATGSRSRSTRRRSRPSYSRMRTWTTRATSRCSCARASGALLWPPQAPASSRRSSFATAATCKLRTPGTRVSAATPSTTRRAPCMTRQTRTPQPGCCSRCRSVRRLASAEPSSSSGPPDTSSGHRPPSSGRPVVPCSSRGTWGGRCTRCCDLLRRGRRPTSCSWSRRTATGGTRPTRPTGSPTSSPPPSPAVARC